MNRLVCDRLNTSKRRIYSVRFLDKIEPFPVISSHFSNIVFFHSALCKMLRRPDTPVLPKSASRMAIFGTVMVSLGLILSTPDKDSNGRDHIFSPIIRASNNALSLGLVTLEIKAIDSVIAKRDKQAKEQARSSPVDSQ